MHKIYTGPYVLIAYVVGGGAIYAGAIHSYIGLCIGLAMLFFWDLFYVLNESSFVGRSVSRTNESVTRARTYISWYIGIYGVIIGLAATNKNDLSAFSTALSSSSTPISLVALPLVLSILSMLFIPIQLSGNDGEDRPNTALKALFFLVVYIQKVILILIGHIGLRTMSAWV